MVEVRRAGDDQRGSGPRLFAQQERHLQHPVDQVLPLLDRIAVADEQPALLLVEIPLQPHRRVQPRGELLADDAPALDPDDVETAGTVIDPGRSCAIQAGRRTSTASPRYRGRRTFSASSGPQSK